MASKKVALLLALAVTVAMAACLWNRKAPDKHVGIFQGVDSRLLNPADYRDVILSNFPALTKYLEQQSFLSNIKNESEANIYLALINIEWGNYPEAVFYARRGAEPAPKPSNVRVYALAVFLSGGKPAEALLQGNDPLVHHDFSAFGTYAQLVTSRGDTPTKQGEIRRMIATTSNEAYDFLLSFLLSHAPDADVAELDMIAGEVIWCFNQYAGIEVQTKDGAESIMQIPGRMEIARDGALEFGLCSLAMADLYFKGGHFQTAETWNRRAVLAYHLAEKSVNFSPAFRHRFNALAETGSRAKAPLNLTAP